jgi:hypothetical protein
MASKVLKDFIEVGPEYLGVERGVRVEIGVLVVYVDQFFRGFRDWGGRWGRLEVLSTVSDVEHCCFEVLVEGVVINGVLAP